MAPRNLFPRISRNFRGFSLAPPRPYHQAQLSEGEMCMLWSMRASIHRDTHAPCHRAPTPRQFWIECSRMGAAVGGDWGGRFGTGYCLLCTGALTCGVSTSAIRVLSARCWAVAHKAFKATWRAAWTPVAAARQLLTQQREDHVKGDASAPVVHIYKIIAWSRRLAK